MKKKAKKKKKVRGFHWTGWVKAQNQVIYTVHPRTIFVGAGNYEQFERYVRPRMAEGLTFVYADGPHRILGHKGHVFITTGTFYLRPDAKKIEDLVKRQLI